MMTNKSHSELAEEFLSILESEGIKAVSLWTLPNSETPFDDDAEASLFEKEIDGYFDLGTEAIKGIVPRKLG